MEHLINRRRVVLSNNNRGSHSSVLKVQNIIKIATLMVATFIISFSYGQDRPLPEKGDITYRLRKEYKKPTVNEVNKIPVATLSEFNADFSDAQDASWKVRPTYNEVDFIKDNQTMMAFYNYDDELIGTGHYVAYMDLPLKGRERIEKDYGDYIPEQAMFFHDDNEDDTDLLNLLGNFLPEEAYFVLLRNEDKEIVVQVDKDGEVAYFDNVR